MNEARACWTACVIVTLLLVAVSGLTWAAWWLSSHSWLAAVLVVGGPVAALRVFAALRLRGAA